MCRASNFKFIGMKINSECLSMGCQLRWTENFLSIFKILNIGFKHKHPISLLSTLALHGEVYFKK